jgi:hypothetical protein
MSTLMTNELMLRFTFKGKTGKENFSASIFVNCVCGKNVFIIFIFNFILIQQILEAVKKNPRALGATDKDIEAAMDYWIKKASTRLEIQKK